MADTDKDAEKEVTAPLSVKKPEAPEKPEISGEDDVTAKIPRPVPKKPVLSAEAKNDAAPLTSKNDGSEEQTAKVPKIPKPPEDAKPDAIPLKKPAGEEDQTAKIPKPLKPGDAKKVVLNSATESTIRPSDATTMAPAVVPESIDMKQTESGNVAVVGDIPGDVKEVKPVSATPPPAPATPSSTQGRKTIKLKPLKKDVPAAADDDDNAEETLSMDRNALMDGENMPSLAGGPAATKEENLEDESTVKIQKPEMAKPAHPTPIVPGSKETIKLRPSTTPPPPIGGAGVTKTEPAAADEAEETLAVSKKTIRLVPKKPGEDDSTQKTPKQEGAAPVPGAPPSAKPSAPTVKLQEPDDVTQKTARPSAPTVKLPDESPAAAAISAPPPEAGGNAPSSSKKTLKLKATAPATASPQAARGPDGGGMPPPVAPDAEGPTGGMAAPTVKEAGSEPGIVMTLVAFVTLVTIAYYVWMVGGQWAEQYQEVESCNVPALSGTVK